jgi:hypothetical protein
MKITQQQIHGINVSGVREEQKEDGAFDGRFNTRRVDARKGAYKRKEKHPGRGWDE